MEQGNDSEKLIGKLIKKRKEENKAFTKLIHAIESKTPEAESPKESTRKSKLKTNK